MRAITNDSLVLFSGGMDSTIALFHRLVIARREGVRVHALTFVYGQRHANEANHAADIIDLVRGSDEYGAVMATHLVQRLTIPRFKNSSLLSSVPVTKYNTVAEANAWGGEDSCFIPYRNLVMLSHAAMYAYHVNARIISTGLRGGFADCTADFERMMQNVFLTCVPDFPIIFDTPTHRTREQCLRYAQTLPHCMEALALTMTCFEGRYPPCGHCVPCLKRAAGFAAVGIQDPIL